jgi:hypothetical protein
MANCCLKIIVPTLHTARYWKKVRVRKATSLLGYGAQHQYKIVNKCSTSSFSVFGLRIVDVSLPFSCRFLNQERQNGK